MNTGRLLSALAILAVLFVGCVKAPPPTTPQIDVDTPDDWSARDEIAGAVETKWWDGFGDAHLAALVEIALEENTDLWAAAARVDRAAAEARIAGADLKPRVNAGIDVSRQKFSPSLFGQSPDDAQPGGFGSTTFTRYGLSLDVAWEVDLWGRLRAGARAALLQAQAVDADFAAAKLSIAGQTAKTWFAVEEALQQVELARSSAESFRKLSEQVRVRYEMGIRPPLDLRLALSNEAGAEALLQRRQRQLDGALRQLEILLARYPSAALLERYPSAGLPDLAAPVPAGLPAEIVSRRPDLVAAERRLMANDQQLLAARRALYPRLSLTGSGGSLALEIADLLDGDFGVWTLAANLVQPIFEGGRLRAGVDAAAAGSDETFAQYVTAVLRAYGEVETALAAEAYLTARAGHLEEAATQLVAAQRIAEDRYREGLGGYLVVLESQTRALLAQSELLVVRRELLENRVDLHLALGGGFDYPAPGTDSEPDTVETAQIAEESAP